MLGGLQLFKSTSHNSTEPISFTSQKCDQISVENYSIRQQICRAEIVSRNHNRAEI